MKMFRFVMLSLSLFGGTVYFVPAHAQDEENKPVADAPVEQPAGEAPVAETPAETPAEQPAEQPPAETPAPETPAPETPAGKTDEQTASGLKAEVALTGLNNPCGIALQPETGIVFIADSGNLQIVKIVDGKSVPVITEFPKDVYGKGPMVNIGPLGLLFLNKNTLVVGGGGLPDGEELLRVYELPEDGSAIKADAMKTSFKLEENEEMKGEGNFYALAATPEAIYVTCNGDDTKGWVSRAMLKDNEVSGYERYLSTKEATEVDAPVGITVSPEGYLVVGQMGEINVPGDSLITFYDANSTEMRLNLKTGLHDITAVAYSPRNRMYVLDYAWADPSQGGLFQIVEDKESETGMRTKKIMSLDKPTAMVFDADGSLYITVLGIATDGNSEGQLIKVEAGL